MPNIAAIQRVGGLGATPPTPTLAYTGLKQFTITNYDSTLTYTLTNCTRSGSVITVTNVGTNATVTARYGRGLSASAAGTGATLANGRVLTGAPTNYTDTGCGPRGTSCCSGGQILNVDGSTCSSVGSLAPDNFCGGSCPGNCFQMTISCYSYYWTDYTSSGYTISGSTTSTSSVWGKVL